MVLADSHRLSRIRRYSGYPTRGHDLSHTGLLPAMARLSRTLLLGACLCNSVKGLVPLLSDPTTPSRQRHQAIAPTRFRLFPFRSPLLRESLLLSLPRGTQMFQFPRFPLSALFCSGRSDTPLRVSGFPIRTSTDRSSVGSSPWLIAASHVLLRLQAPRHPPLALCSLENKDARARYGILKGLQARKSRSLETE